MKQSMDMPPELKSTLQSLFKAIENKHYIDRQTVLSQALQTAKAGELFSLFEVDEHLVSVGGLSPSVYNDPQNMVLVEYDPKTDAGKAAMKGLEKELLQLDEHLASCPSHHTYTDENDGTHHTL